MKQRSTTPVSKGFAAKSILVACAVLMAVATPMTMMPRAKADQYDDKINALQQQANQYQSQASSLGQQANTLQNKLDDLAGQKASVTAQIDISQAKYDKLQQQIVETQQKIKDNQDALGSTIANLYVDDSISPLEMLASSQNIGDYVDKQTYRSSVQDQLTKTISTIKDLKTSLENDKKSVKNVLDVQTAQRNSLVAIEAQQQVLLDQTKGQEAAYQQLVGSAKSQMAQVAAQQQAAISAAQRRGSNSSFSVGALQIRNYSGNQGCSGGYRYCGGMDSFSDPWGLYNRECVSYTAQKVSDSGRYIANFGGAGNAYEWPNTTLRMGANVDNSPEVGTVAILPPIAGYSPIGHAMYVESVLGDGWVHVSQYNFGGTGEYSTMDIKASSVVFIHFR